MAKKKISKKPVIKRTGTYRRTSANRAEETTSRRPPEFDSDADIFADQSDYDDQYDHLEQEVDPDEKYMSIGEHLEELRRRLIGILAVIAATSLVAGIFYRQIHGFLIGPYLEVTEQKHDLILNRMYGNIEIIFKLSFMMGFVVSLPICIFILWGFVTPAVTRRTAWLGHLTVAASTFLFWLGIYVCWIYIFPISMQFLLVDTLLEGVAPMTSLENYYSFVMVLHIGSGLAFQLPIIMISLGALGIVTTDWHKAYWRYIVILTLVFSAIITPPDPGSMFILGLMLQGLYAISFLVVWIIERMRRKREIKEQADYEAGL
ncbi:MAG: twin-arginine translocase subunit TatC [Leptospiraceae bacterium]|nr:twin-arginine translocase subunit TatC [Leptospiraceae bacterium]